MIVCAVAGNSFTHVKEATVYMSNRTDLNIMPALSKPSLYIAVTTATICAVLCLLLTLATMRVYQIKRQHITDTPCHTVITYLVRHC